MEQDAADTFVRYEADGKTIDIPIERLRICGIGRAVTNMVVLTDSMASREHAMIRRNAAGQCVLNDLGSTNGTWLNDRSVTVPTPLTSGDVIQIGRQRITFFQNSAPLALDDGQAARTQFLLAQQLVSVLVVDMRNFSKCSAQMGPEKTAQMMGEIYREAGDLLNQANSWSTKFSGDAIMALWVHADMAVHPADVVRTFDVISGYQGIFRVAERKYHPPMPLRFGCGYSAGMASVGNIGSAGAADFTAMGETVNTAFRLEAATKEVGCDVLISRTVFDHLADSGYRPNDMIDLTLRGYEHPVTALPLHFHQVSDFLNGFLAAI